MGNIAFKKREKLSEYLNENELEYSVWYATNASGRIIKKSKIVYPNLGDNKFLYSKYLEHEGLMKSWKPLDFFNSLYDVFTFILHDYKDEFKSFYSATHGLPYMFDGDYEQCFLLYSICYLLFEHSEFDAWKYLPGPRKFKSIELWDIGTMVIDEYSSLSGRLGIKIESPDDEVQFDMNSNDKLYPDGLSLKQIALFYYYTSRKITRANASKILKGSGWNSAEKLYQYYSHFKIKRNITGNPGSKEKLQNKIDLLESIIICLDNKDKVKVTDDIKILKLLPSSDY